MAGDIRDTGSTAGLGRREKGSLQKGPLEKGSAIYSSMLAWRIPWTETDWLQSIGSHRVGHD